jgi:3-phosphoshikimate 1-carboxyvinyltransferase
MPNPINVKIPGSKSVSNRCLVLAAFGGTVGGLFSCESQVKGKIIRNILKAEDTQVMFEAYEKLGVKFKVLNEVSESIDIQIYEQANSEKAEFFMNNSGTSTRFLIPCLCLLKGEFKLDGIERMRQRPIGDLVLALRGLGVRIEYLEKEGFLPLKIFSNGVLNGVAKIKCDLSSQYLSGLMLARALSKNSFEVEILGNSVVSKPYIDLTEQVIKDFFEYDQFVVETDYSSASYFIALGVLSDKSIFIENISENSLQADKKFVEALQELGAELEYKNGGLLCLPSKLKANSNQVIDCTDFPDSAMTLAIACGLLEGVESKLTGLSTLKHKECDRLIALETELRKVGITVEADKDSLTIKGIASESLLPAKIETYNDHRMAMCFAILKHFNQEIEILNPECVNKTFPGFWGKLKLL